LIEPENRSGISALLRLLSLIYRWTTERSKRIEPSSKSPSNSKVSISQRSLPGHKAGFAHPSLHLKFSFPGLGGDRFDDWVVGRQFEPNYLHHPVSANRAFPARRQIGRFCGHFRRLNSRILVSVGVRAFWRRLLAPCLCIQKFRSRRPWLSAQSERGRSRIPGFALP
jgi:hypothetical protein